MGGRIRACVVMRRRTGSLSTLRGTVNFGSEKKVHHTGEGLRGGGSIIIPSRISAPQHPGRNKRQGGMGLIPTSFAGSLQPPPTPHASAIGLLGALGAPVSNGLGPIRFPFSLPK